MKLSDILPIPELESCKSLLCIQPHPDDNEIGAGATIAKLSSLGCKITYLTVTDGRIGSYDPNARPEEIAATRRAEAQRSAAFLGVSDVLFLDYPDGSYPDEETLCRSIVGAVRKVKPELLLAPDPFLPYECHPDHRRVGMAAAEACIFSGFPGFKTEGGDAPWAVRGIAFHSTACPNTFINVETTWDAKMKAIAIHESQFTAEALQRLGMYFIYKASLYAEGRGFSLAEAFKVLSGDHLHMNVDTVNL